MSAADQGVHVLRLACLTEDRTPEEQRALIAMALSLDAHFAALTSKAIQRGTQHRPRYTFEVLGTVDENCDGGQVELTKAQRGQLERLVAKWEMCEKCGVIVGMHGVDDCK